MEITRKLASIQLVGNVVPIEGADNLELAWVNGWSCVVSKGQFKPNDKCIYFEVDSVLPIDPQYEFLRARCYVNKDWLGEGFRLKTIMLRKTLSQGLIVPYSGLLPIDTDMTEQLGVKKWEPPISASLAGQAKGNFPSFIPKTDQERIQTLFNKVNEKYSKLHWEVTLKCDGSSMTVYNLNGTVGVCSRNLELKMDESNSENSFVKQAFTIKDKLITFGKNIALQGELMGQGIQGNREKLLNLEFFVFDIYDIDAKKYLTSFERLKICKLLGIKHVPVIYENFSFDKTEFSISNLLEMADIKSITHNIAEGVVFKCVDNPSISFKVINNKFLLKEQ
jgi:RNA ligase (TIGR02306 family)